MPDEEKDEAQDTRSVLEEAYDKAMEPEPEEKVEAEAKPEEPEEKPAEEVTAEATPTPGDPLPEEEAKEAKEVEEVEEQPKSLDAPHNWAVEHQEMFRELDPKAQSFLVDRATRNMEAAHTKRTHGNRAAQEAPPKSGPPTCPRCRPIRPRHSTR